MAKFKLIVSDPRTGKCVVSELEGTRAQALIGRSLGELVDGSALGIAGSAVISGGCDKNGVPMRADVHGGAKKYIVLSFGPGFRPHNSGERKRKLIRGRTITDETYQINVTLRKEAGTQLKQKTVGDVKTAEGPQGHPRSAEASTPVEKTARKLKESKKSKKGR
jgi:small subunit ribosomal protein S6e